MQFDFRPVLVKSVAYQGECSLLTSHITYYILNSWSVIMEVRSHKFYFDFNYKINFRWVHEKDLRDSYLILPISFLLHFSGCAVPVRGSIFQFSFGNKRKTKNKKQKKTSAMKEARHEEWNIEQFAPHNFLLNNELYNWTLKHINCAAVTRFRSTV